MILADNHSINDCAKNLHPNPTQKISVYERLTINSTGTYLPITLLVKCTVRVPKSQILLSAHIGGFKTKQIHEFEGYLLLPRLWRPKCDVFYRNAYAEYEGFGERVSSLVGLHNFCSHKGGKELLVNAGIVKGLQLIEMFING